MYILYCECRLNELKEGNMTLVPIKCPYCEKDVSIIIEVGETKQYICFQCSNKFTVQSNIQILKSEELK